MSQYNLKDRSFEQRQYTARVVVIFLLAVVGVMILLGRLVQLQVVEHEAYRVKSDENRIQLQPIAPLRGLVFDRNGVVLADNRPVFALNLITEHIDDLDQMLATLAELIEITDDDYSIHGFNVMASP